MDPKEALDNLGAKWSPDLDSYADGTMTASEIRCALCAKAPCECPEFGSPEYFALLDRRHGKGGK